MEAAATEFRETMPDMQIKKEEQKQSRIMVTVACITYNHAAYIRQAIESFLMQQTNFAIEIIVHDDASTDGTTAIVQEYASRCPGLIIPMIQTENQYSKGIKPLPQIVAPMARGKYIAWCEGDDYWTDPLKLQKQLDYLELHDSCSLVCTKRFVLTTSGELLEEKTEEKQIYNSCDVLNGFVPGSQTIVFRNYPAVTSFFNKQAKNMSGDRYLAYFCSLFGDLHQLKDRTAVYRQTETGVWMGLHPLEKLQRYNTEIQTMYQSLGVPLNNCNLATVEFNTSFRTFTYCIRRPALLRKKENRAVILKPWKQFYQMNRMKFVYKVFMNWFRWKVS